MKLSNETQERIINALSNKLAAAERSLMKANREVVNSDEFIEASDAADHYRDERDAWKAAYEEFMACLVRAAAVSRIRNTEGESGT